MTVLTQPLSPKTQMYFGGVTPSEGHAESIRTGDDPCMVSWKALFVWTAVEWDRRFGSFHPPPYRLLLWRLESWNEM